MSSRYIIGRGNQYVSTGEGTVTTTTLNLLTEDDVKTKYNGSTLDYVKKRLADSWMQEGDILYELKPIVRVQRQLVAARIKTL